MENSASLESNSRILVVDDEEIVRETVGAILKRYTDYETDFAENGKDALEKWKKANSSNQGYDLFIIDLRMPKMDGTSLIKEIRQSEQDLAFIVLTGHGSYDEASSLLKNYHISDFVKKPFKYPQQLIFSVENALEKRNLERQLKRSKNQLEEKVAERTADYKKAKEEADRANQLKSEFLANMSHELRTPLHGILGYAKLAVERFEKLSKEKSLKYFNNIINAGDRLLSLINDLLDLSKQEAGRVEYNFIPSALSKLVQVSIYELDVLLKEKNISVIYSNPDFEDLVWMDSEKILQVIRNLLSNAIKFSHEGGDIEIAIEDDNDTLAFSITDHGVGIPEDELTVVFDKFVQSSRIKTGAGGTGLGLSICHHIISDHKGKIWAESNPAGGATLRFILPYEQKAG